MTEIRGKQIRDGTVNTLDLVDNCVTKSKININTAGSAVITKAVQGTNGSINLNSTGADSGTGEVTFSVNEAWVKTTSTSERFRIKVTIVGNYNVGTANVLEKIPFDSSLLEYDNGEHRYNIVNKNLFVKANEVWDINVSALIDSSYAYSIVIYDETNSYVVSSSYVIPSGRFTMSHINTLFSPSVDSYVGVYIFVDNLPTSVKYESPHNYSSISLCNFKRIK